MRREFHQLPGGGAVTSLLGASPPRLLKGFCQGLRDLGYVQGRDALTRTVLPRGEAHTVWRR